MATFIKNNELSTIVTLHSNKSIGVTFSCWDLLHAGHNLFLRDVLAFVCVVAPPDGYPLICLHAICKLIKSFKTILEISRCCFI